MYTGLASRLPPYLSLLEHYASRSGSTGTLGSSSTVESGALLAPLRASPLFALQAFLTSLQLYEYTPLVNLNS